MMGCLCRGWTVDGVRHGHNRACPVHGEEGSRIGVDVHSVGCVDYGGKIECRCGLDDRREVATEAMVPRD